MPKYRKIVMLDYMAHDILNSINPGQVIAQVLPKQYLLDIYLYDSEKVYDRQTVDEGQKGSQMVLHMKGEFMYIL